ncbi:MAG: hypothetical protein LW834_00320 [Cyanobium sp. 49614_E6]|nr:hypothetical protein [Cyanobium sp. 49614_E6]
MPAQRRAGGGSESSRLFASDYIRGAMAKDAGYGNANPIGEQLAVLGAARNNLDARSAGVITGSDDKDYRVFAKKGQDYEALRNDTLKRAGGGTGNARFSDAEAFDSAVASSYGAEAVDEEIAGRFAADAHAAHLVADSARLWAEKGAGNAVRNVGRDLISDKPELQAQALEAMNITAEKIQMVHGAAAADGFKVEVATKLTSGDGNAQKEALAMLGIAEDKYGTVLKPEVNDATTFQMPYLQDMPLWGHAIGAGSAAAGAGALAYHLMVAGQQQQDPAAYAATVQAMNAY